jgi:hypothetical protein
MWQTLLLISCNFHSQLLVLKVLPSLLWQCKLLTKFSDGIREFIKHMFQFLVEAVLHIINCFLYWGMNVQNNDMTPGTLSIMYDILSLRNSNLLTANIIVLCTKKHLIHASHSPFLRKMCTLLLVWCHWPPTLPLTN